MRGITVLVCFILSMLTLFRFSTGAEKQSPRLILMIAVDQFRGDYLDRFQEVFVDGGLRRFMEQGVFFSDAHHDHANTSTAPGHATIVTGAYPSHSGIVNNQWYEENGSRAVYCVGDENSPVVRSGERVQPGTTSTSGRSPRNLFVTALPDWIKDADPESKAFSVSRKDRASILMGGKTANAAYWYDGESGDFISSAYYLQEMPGWVNRFNRKKIPKSYFGKPWSPLSSGRSPSGRLELADPDHGWFDHGFPHALGDFSPRPNASFYTEFGNTPLMDAYMAQFALELIENEALGKDDHLDYLSLSFSVLDSVGHAYGPHSTEVLDTVSRLDRVLAQLFSYIDEQVGLDRTLIVFCSDHGVMDLPEYLARKGQYAHRIDDDDILCLQEKGADFALLYGDDEDWFVSGFHLNDSLIERKGLLKQEVERTAADLFSQCAYVRRVWTRTDLENVTGDENDSYLLLFWKSFHTDRSPDLLFQAEEFHLGSQDTGTSHGSPYSYDTHVPIVFLLPQILPARIEDRVATVDIAPTLASLLQIKAPNTVDGQDLTRYFPAGN